MLNVRDIMTSAWAKYRETIALIGLTSFSRKHFAHSLSMAWYDAKLVAHIAQQMAEEAAEALANPAAADARAELTFLNMKDRWTSEDRARVSTLHQAIAA